ncbi:hypothetical protein MHM88_07070 [Epibacterium sp. MM17-32]|uniref:hypothetical protein n=1 Tax=Epibacterium sp. MM17-32 TaxID=2917734 RepID=UPI001EF439C0|nr:hypothetical protein [Epibacterium sp. MM17-32]MCG7627559.1 hypothetical protein [Epibacterium sp. MM17-32]
MSEPVTHAEIEDVLSSIRRLVRETGRNEGGSGGESAAAAVATGPAEPASRPATRLVLTPALRVPDDEISRADTVSPDPEPKHAAPETHAAPEAERTPDGAKAHEAPGNVSRVLADQLSAGPNADGASDRQAEESGAEAAEYAEEAPFVAVEDDEAADLGTPNGTTASLHMTHHAELRETQAAPAEARDAGGAIDAVTDPSAEEIAPEPDAESEPEQAPWRDPNAKLFDVVSEQALRSETSAPALDSVTSQPPREQSARVAAVVRRIAELETAGQGAGEAPASRNGVPVPDLNEDEIEAVPASGPSVETIQWEDHLDAAPARPSFSSSREATEDTARRLTQDAAEETAMAAVSASEEFLDEESLRELVSDIVREELQGALGERITRNVRKLVRREIQRALASQELL